MRAEGALRRHASGALRKMEQAAAHRWRDRRNAAAALRHLARKPEVILAFPLRVGSLKRQAVFAQLFPPFAPRFVHRTLRIIPSPLPPRKLNGEHPVKTP